ncbi:MAG: hypothetical protein LBJ01_03255 [Tannerella sp.]|jgi:hypothetical protein|nr:hypothetical protein [Tannerella sp.]
MATIIKKPSGIHAAFNPVILQVRAATQEERESGIKCTLSSGARSSVIGREFFNDLTRFDLSGILKYRFTEETADLPQPYCFLDGRLAFEYGIDLSASTHIAVNAVAQLQRNPDMSTWGDRFLTDLPAIKKYRGYPLDVSYLNNSRSAVIAFDGETLNENDPVADLHFSITIPDDTASVTVSNALLPICLLTNSGEKIQTNGLRDIIVENPAQAAAQAKGGIVSSCTPGSPCYLRWINRLGGFDYRMFCLNQVYGQSVKMQTVVSPVIDDILNAGCTDYGIDAEVVRTVSVGAGGLTGIEYNELLNISTSPRVEVWDVEVRKWFRVHVASGKFEHGTRDTRKEIELELTLPTLQMQF